ncbi:MAG: GNAT family N-acetyltransferase [Eggerthellaceae bacterium]|nr:GNAT family N-acetyltransferase [Eggerthellaceae bacterium]
MSVLFVPVKTDADKQKLADIAGRIWREYWPPRIGEAQTEYMIENFQSLSAIRRDMSLEENPYEYWFIVECDCDIDAKMCCIEDSRCRIVGYTGGHDEPQTKRFFISKVYLFAEERGKGYASKTMAFYERLCKQRGFVGMYLTVNKYNELGVRAYKGKGFVVIDSIVKDIGDGFVMDDYVMEKRLG